MPPSRQIRYPKTPLGSLPQATFSVTECFPIVWNKTMLQTIQTAFRHVDRWSSQEWLLALIIVLAIGFCCMRGLGSRSKF